MGAVETYTDLALNPSLDPTSPLTRTSTRACTDGHYCDSGQAIRCPLGHWCLEGVQHTCPAGTMGNATMLSSPACNGLCTVNHFCPIASTAPEVCPPGTVGQHAGLKSIEECSDCPAGYWCNSGKQFNCNLGYYTETDQPSRARQDLSACIQCPKKAITKSPASATASSCVCDEGFFLLNAMGTNLSDGINCLTCPTGTSCVAGTTLMSLPVEDGYWKPGYDSTIAKPCPHRSTCSNGPNSEPRYATNSSDTCTADRGVAGIYCLLCAEPGHFFDSDLEMCKYVSTATLPRLHLMLFTAQLLRTRIENLTFLACCAQGVWWRDWQCYSPSPGPGCHLCHHQRRC